MSSNREQFSIIERKIQNDKRITKNGILTYQALKYFYNIKNGRCYPSKSTLMKIARQSEETLNKGIEELVKYNYISVKKRYNDKTKQYYSNQYFISDLSNIEIEPILRKEQLLEEIDNKELTNKKKKPIVIKRKDKNLISLVKDLCNYYINLKIFLF